MSPRESSWFLAGALTTVAVLVSTGLWNPFTRLHALPAQVLQPAAMIASASSVASSEMTTGNAPSVPELVAGGSAASGHPAPVSAGSLDEVTRKLAARLATQGGSDGEWRLLAQSYEYMGLTSEARAAKAHISLSEGNVDHAAQGITAGTVQAVSTEQMAAVAQLLDSQSAANTRAATVTDGPRSPAPRQAGP